MKSFRFNSIYLLSQKEHKARSVHFHQKKNLILGRNHTGKSSLIRSLFVTLGAMPKGKLDQWDSGIISGVEFSIDDDSYFAIHQSGHRALFDSSKSLIAATRNRQFWNEQFSRITGFNLVFGDAESGTYPADVSCFFLPFYINQDGSWQAGWHTFEGVNRLNSRKDILEYFCGIKPPNYYTYRAVLNQEKTKLLDVEKERNILKQTRARFDKTFSLAGPKINANAFQNEINMLTLEMTELNAKQEKLRSKSVREEELYASLQMQIKMAADALYRYDKNTTYLGKNAWGTLICPVCHAEHTDPFMDMLTYAEDARILRDLAFRLNNDIETIKARHEKTLASMEELESNYQKIAEILDIKRGEFKFKDVVDSIGAQNALAAFESQDIDLKSTGDELRLTIHGLEVEIDKLVNKTRTKDILKIFRDKYFAFCSELNLPLPDVSLLGLIDRPASSGSIGPRSILAYYAALWYTCCSQKLFDIPVIIDTPNQQAQDDINLPAIDKFITNKLPQQLQLIVGQEQESDYEYNKIIHLDKNFSLLRDNEFCEVEQVLKPLEQTMINEILRQDLPLFQNDI